MEGHPHQHQHQHQYGGIHVQAVDSTIGGGISDRLPQWSPQETMDFLMIRADLDRAFMETKRNKLLWEVVATKMREKGYNRSAEQCKCKWKNLVTRYKGCEAMEPEGMRQQFPFYNEVQAIFAARMQLMLWMEAEGSGAGGSKKKVTATLSSSDEEDDQNEDSEGEKMNIVSPAAAVGTTTKKKRKGTTTTKGGGGAGSSTGGGGGNNPVVNSLKEVLEDFIKQQLQTEMEWLKAYEAREEERQKREMEWRRKMEALENERVMMERMWREREEQRRIREEARAERRDALVSALLEKLTREDS